ncbi:MAG: hypothetical protein A2283_18020 [Lentisphaerae bacterium RIFOXYA12_FULL_48_11]|nr:MAG: hypothetical protein A2283_18020 [Lentisphaerae bacterium RIFOXYA12_FULL_48_11]
MSLFTVIGLTPKTQRPLKVFSQGRFILCLGWLIVCGCSREVVKDDKLLVGNYEEIGVCNVRKLEIFSNKTYQCECDVSGVWMKIDGEWELDENDGYIHFRDMLDDKTNHIVDCLPTEIIGKNIYIYSTEGAMFKKRANPSLP